MIESLKNAETLEIINSTITEYPTRIFSRLPKIKKIVVLTSTFNIMDPNIYDDSNHLESILFAKNNVPSLPLTLLRKTTFEKIIISDQSQVKIIPENFANETKRLKIFECSRCNIESVEQGAFNNLGDLEVLNLMENSINHLPSEIFSPVANLRELNLSGNHIEKFTADQLRNNNLVEVIDLSNNPLKDLHLLEVTKVAPKLKKLDVRGTKLSKNHLKEHIDKLHNVEILSD